ncbi:MAG TPA: hypothetical protein V6C81_21735 [Planktothrix sp.]|jgi:hypothetical protein
MTESSWIIVAMVLLFSARGWFEMYRMLARRRSFDQLALLAGLMEDLTKAGIPSQAKTLTEYAAVEFSWRIANAYQAAGQFSKAAETAKLAQPKAQSLLDHTAARAA